MNGNQKGSKAVLQLPQKRKLTIMHIYRKTDGLPPTPDSENKLLRTWMGQDLSPMATPGSTQMNGMWSPKLQSYVSPQVGGRTMNAPTPGSSYLTGGNAATQAGFANSTPATNETHAKPYATKREQQRMRQREMEARARELKPKIKGKLLITHLPLCPANMLPLRN